MLKSFHCISFLIIQIWSELMINVFVDNFVLIDSFVDIPGDPIKSIPIFENLG